MADHQVIINSQVYKLIPLGFCACGCGGRTRLVSQTSKKNGRVKGQCNKYIIGHSFKKLSGKEHSNWKGGRHIMLGYIKVYQPSHPCAYGIGYMLEHRLVMEEYLGRYLDAGEIVHHIDGSRDNNVIENLELCLSKVHIGFHKLGKPMSAEQKAKQSAAVSGKNHPNYGKRLSDATVAKMRAASTGRKHSPETKAQMSTSAKTGWLKRRG